MDKPKTSLQLFRDTLRLISHVAGASSPKAVQLRQLVKTQFRANRFETDDQKLHALKQGVERCLSNYLLYEKSLTDPRMMKMLAKGGEELKFHTDADGNLFRVDAVNHLQVDGEAVKPEVVKE